MALTTSFALWDFVWHSLKLVQRAKGMKKEKGRLQERMKVTANELNKERERLKWK
jgi:hypothetical protein